MVPEEARNYYIYGAPIRAVPISPSCTLVVGEYRVLCHFLDKACCRDIASQEDSERLLAPCENLC